MKNKIIMLITSVVIIIFIGIISYVFIMNKAIKDVYIYEKEVNVYVKEFNLFDYQDKLEEFPSDKILGEIKDENDAIQKAKDAWILIYGEKVINGKPIEVSYDKNNDVWLVQGTFDRNNDIWSDIFQLLGGDIAYQGGVPNIIIRKSDGKVLALWHDM